MLNLCNKQLAVANQHGYSEGNVVYGNYLKLLKKTSIFLFHCYFINIVLFQRRDTITLAVFNVFSLWQHLIKCNFWEKCWRKHFTDHKRLSKPDQALIKPQRASFLKTNRPEVILWLNARINLARQYFY